jgi:hypothetical protein
MLRRAHCRYDAKIGAFVEGQERCHRRALQDLVHTFICEGVTIEENALGGLR